MHILSFDVASKSLAVSLLQFNENWKPITTAIMQEFKESCLTTNIATDICQLGIDCINKLENVHNNLITPIMFDVVDLIPNKKLKETTVIERASRLSGYLTSLEKYIHNICSGVIKVLLEYQMGPNDKSRNVGSQILYHYSNPSNDFSNVNDALKNNTPINNSISYDIEIVGPSLKNKINLNPKLSHKYFVERYIKTYDANKKHSVANFLHWLKLKNAESMIDNIKKKNWDDIADSVTMTLAWLMLKSDLL